MGKTEISRHRNLSVCLFSLHFGDRVGSMLSDTRTAKLSEILVSCGVNIPLSRLNYDVPTLHSLISSLKLICEMCASENKNIFVLMTTKNFVVQLMGLLVSFVVFFDQSAERQIV